MKFVPLVVYKFHQLRIETSLLALEKKKKRQKVKEVRGVSLHHRPNFKLFPLPYQDRLPVPV